MAVPRSRALDRPRPRRSKHPERWSVEINEQNRPVLIQMIALLARMRDIYQEDPAKQKHLEAVTQSLRLLRTLIDTNPKVLVLDPDDFVQRSIMLYLDETCWGLILKWMEQKAFEQEVAITGNYAAYY